MNIDTIIQCIDIFKPDDKLIEVRAMTGRRPLTGYFKNKTNLLKELQRYPNEVWYFVYNGINEACYSRSQCERIIQAENKNYSTSDADIRGYDWILIDCDPVRATGVSANDEEKECALKLSREIYKWLRNVGFAYPVVCDSGNGYHLLYKVELANKAENIELLKEFLKTLDAFFSNEEVKVDTSVFNPSRITKLYGTIARKGANTKARPHRESKILSVPTTITHTPKTLIQKIVDMLPKPEPNDYRNYRQTQSFDLDEFIQKHGIQVARVSDYAGGRKYVLDHCVFNPEHKKPDSAIFRFTDGRIGYKCFHNSCSDKTWKDVRLLFEPNAYDRFNQRGYNEQPRTTSPIHYETRQEDNAPKKNLQPFFQMKDILPIDRNKMVAIPSGIKGIDEKIIGFNKGEFTLWSGSNASGKSSVLSQIALQACNDGFKVAIFSGELTANRMKYWLELQAAGRQFVSPSKFGNSFYVPKDTSQSIDNWLQDKLFIYNNDLGNKVLDVFNTFRKIIEAEKVDMIIIDNLMALDISVNGSNKFDNQSMVAQYLSALAKDTNTHVHFVCHPRKTIGFLRKTDVSGSADLTNAADNVCIVHRVNKDFLKGLQEFNPQIVSKYEEFGNVIEIAKNRDLGIQDEFIGTYFEIESKRFLNERYENKIFGWQDNAPDDGFEIIEDDGVILPWEM